MSRPFAVRFAEKVAERAPTAEPAELTPEFARFLDWLADEAFDEAVREAKAKEETRRAP